MTTEPEKLQEARDLFIEQWGAMGSLWGVTRTMAQTHAALLAAEEPVSTDDLMHELGISRGNANQTLRQLVEWGLVRSVRVRGDRKEYFVAEKKVWKIFCIIARERKRREIDPALAVLRECAARTNGLRNRNAKGFHKLVSQLADFLSTANNILERAAAREESTVIPALLKLFG
ncbi:MAG: helix-turn-helix domain-containing protein [Nannocystaceae bacterium]|nr:helix-turn-helix domain-containing protein [Nannocystaceae bacterium]